jgi:acetyl esterase
LQGLPPTLIVTTRHDPLYEEGVAYAHRLEAAGTCVTPLSLGGQIHGFLTLGGLLEAASATLDIAGHTAAMLFPSDGTGVNPSFLHQER